MMLTPGAKLDPSDLLQNPLVKEGFRREEARRLTDWAYLCRFKAANQVLLQQGAPRVVFIGDSITMGWELGDPSLFSHKVVDRGISGQTSPQILVRFQADVISLHPRVVHLMIGTNDVAGNTGPTSDADIENNIRAMVTLARANKIAVVLASIPPASNMNWKPGLKPAARIKALNAWLRDYAAQTGCVFVDYHKALVDSNGGLLPELSNDGVHPNRNGYAVMRPLAEAAIKAAMARSGR